jgi:hypothetical protein
MTTTPWAERIAPDEKARFEGFAGEMRALQKRNAKNGVSARTLHVKGHVGAVGQLIVNSDVDARFKAGVFAEPSRAWPVYVRFSNGSSRHQHDKAPDVRGVAIKLVGVPGRKIIPGLEDKLTQDFLLIPTPSLPFRTPDEFLAFVRASSQAKSPLALVGKLFGTFGLGRGLQVLRRLGQTPKVTSMVTTRFYTAAPIRIGDTAAKLALFPIPGNARTALPPSPSEGKHGLREDLVHALGATTVEYSVRAQPFIDEASTPIEDASVTWPEANNPYVEIARLVLPKQDVTSARGQEIEALIETLSFDPWHALEAHRPLGAIMRARAVAYRDSVIERGAAAEPETVLANP